jgi:hypothetical protein
MDFGARGKYFNLLSLPSFFVSSQQLAAYAFRSKRSPATETDRVSGTLAAFGSPEVSVERPGSLASGIPMGSFISRMDHGPENRQPGANNPRD